MYSFTDLALCKLLLSTIIMIGRPTSALSRLMNAMNWAASKEPSVMPNRNFPRGLTAEIIFNDLRSPVAVTVGVTPIGAQVVPAW